MNESWRTKLASSELSPSPVCEPRDPGLRFPSFAGSRVLVWNAQLHIDLSVSFFSRPRPALFCRAGGGKPSAGSPKLSLSAGEENALGSKVDGPLLPNPAPLFCSSHFFFLKKILCDVSGFGIFSNPKNSSVYMELVTAPDRGWERRRPPGRGLFARGLCTGIAAAPVTSNSPTDCSLELPPAVGHQAELGVPGCANTLEYCTVPVALCIQ
ncbi:UNVERIFIED_CONTAM: hypothetical protein K2H54_023341 [Gekko kuhli]